MRKNERQGIMGAIEYALDDLRHTWERLWFDRKVTGEVDMFVNPNAQSQEPHQTQPSTAEMFERMYQDNPEPSGRERSPNREPLEPEMER